MSAVVDNQLATFPPLPETIDPEAIDEDTHEMVRGILGTRAHGSGQFRELALEDLKTLGDAAIPALTERLLDGETDSAERVAAAECLGILSSPAASRALLGGVRRGEDSWVRSWSSFHIAEAGQNEVALDLALRLRYEKDPEVVVWLGVALERMDCLATVETIAQIASGPDDGHGVALARAQLALIEERRGKTAAELIVLWDGPDAGQLQEAPPSLGLRRQVWKAAAEFSEKHFQLRNVDDARFALSRMGAWVAEILAPALGDEDLGIRLHVCQVLERMGPRARAVEPYLILALDEPQVAPAAAEALARVGTGASLEGLVLRSAPPYSYELQVACLRALGRLGEPSALDALRAGFERATAPGLEDQRQIAAAALVELSGGLGEGATEEQLSPYDIGVKHLYSVLVAGGPAGAAAEATLDSWLRDRAVRGHPLVAEALLAWDNHGVAHSAIPNTEVAQARRKARAQGLAGRIDALLTPSD